jgi:hypothetical protein
MNNDYQQFPHEIALLCPCSENVKLCKGGFIRVNNLKNIKGKLKGVWYGFK